MPYSKSQLYRITHRLYNELRDNPEFVLRKMRGFYGEYDSATNLITLDYRRALIPTLIHEYLHKWYVDKCETWVLQHESMIVNGLSSRQIRNILKAFGFAISA